MKNMSPTHRFHRAFLIPVVTGFLFITPPIFANTPDAIISAYRAGKHAQALTLIEDYLASGQKDPQILLLRGVIMAETGRTKEAKSVFQGLIVDYPQLPEPYNNLAVIYAADGDFEKARTVLEMAIKTNPSYATAYENLGDIYAKLASDSYAKALNLQPKKNIQPKLRLINQVVALTPSAITSSPAAAVTAGTSHASNPTVTPASNARSAAPPTAVTENSTKDRSAEHALLDPATQEAVSQALERWRQAWSERDIQAYLDSYVPDYTPGPNVTHEQWANERTARIVPRKRIEVRIEDLTLQPHADGGVLARFTQHYRSDNLESRARKELVLVQRQGRWLITRERSR